MCRIGIINRETESQDINCNDIVIMSLIDLSLPISQRSRKRKKQMIVMMHVRAFIIILIYSPLRNNWPVSV